MRSVNVRSTMTTIETLRARLSTCIIEVAVLNGLLGIVVLIGSAARMRQQYEPNTCELVCW